MAIAQRVRRSSASFAPAKTTVRKNLEGHRHPQCLTVPVLLGCYRAFGCAVTENVWSTAFSKKSIFVIGHSFFSGRVEPVRNTGHNQL